MRIITDSPPEGTVVEAFQSNDTFHLKVRDTGDVLGYEFPPGTFGIRTWKRNSPEHASPEAIRDLCTVSGWELFNPGLICRGVD